jgi:tRNA(Ile)-lysidine synthase
MMLPTAFGDHLVSLNLPRGRALVAVSGGPDSVALLDLLHRTRDRHGIEPIVAHFDHGIQPGSGRVAGPVRVLAVALGPPYEVGHGGRGAPAG